MGYEFTSRIRYSETDQNQNLTLPHLTDYFQDSVAFHDSAAGMGLDFWTKSGMMWVLTSWKILIFRMPHIGENVTVRTDSVYAKRCFGNRNMTMRDEDGKMLAAAYAKFVLLTIADGKPCDISEEAVRRYGLADPLPIAEERGRILSPKDTETPDPFTVTMHHLDHNHHVNNAQFLQMMMDYLPEDYMPRMLRVSYHKPALLGDTLYPHIARDGNIIRARLSAENGEPYVIFYFSEEMKEEDRKVGEL